MSVILKELKPREKLGLKEHKIPTVEEIQAIKKSMEVAAKSQSALGLGNPIRASVSVQAQVDRVAKFEKGKRAAKALMELGVFKIVERPNPETFPILDERTLVSFNKLPKFVMCRLNKTISQVQCTSRLDGMTRTFTAQIPLMPTAVQALAARAKETAPSGKFHLLFEPSWQAQPVPVPQRDPVLLYEVAARFFVIGYWDSDAELINKELKQK